RPLVEGADTLVFSRAAYIPDWVPASKSAVIPPSIDPLSPKNRELTAVESAEILGRVGLFDGAFTPDAPLVVQVSRWDRLKDMPGVMQGFVDHLSTASDAVLALVGPDVSGVSDDPEGHAVYVECTDLWESLPSGQRARVRLISLPVDDVDANAEMVNAIQRHASAVVQKSLAEGFGLTVSEGMWKSRPVIGSAVGGIPDQISPGTGLLLDDPTDLDTFGRELRDLLGDEARMASMGAAAHEHIRANFVGDAHLLRWIAVVDRLLD
ncbi:MAG: glycosyltransferase, partial [Acidimicrobiia bacterium]